MYRNLLCAGLLAPGAPHAGFVQGRKKREIAITCCFHSLRDCKIVGACPLAEPTLRTVRSLFTDGLRGDGCSGFSPGRHNNTGYPYCHLACLFRIENQDTFLPACYKIRNNGIGRVICPSGRPMQFLSDVAMNGVSTAEAS